MPPLIVNMGTKAAIAYDLNVLFLGSAIVNTVIFVCIILCKGGWYGVIERLVFSERPPKPPSAAQARAIEESMDANFLSSLKQLCCNCSYMLLLVTYGRELFLASFAYCYLRRRR